MQTNDPWTTHRLTLFRVFIVGAVIVLSIRLWQVQIIEGSSYRLLADRNRLRTVEVAAPRGVVYARDGEILARNRPSFSVVVVPADMPKQPDGQPSEESQAKVLDRLLELLAIRPRQTPSPTSTVVPAAITATRTVTPTNPLADIPEREPWVMPRADIEKAIEDGYWGGAYKPITVARYIDEATAFLVAQDTVNLPGVQVVLVPIRDYTSGALTSALIGYMGPIPEHSLADYEDKGYQQTDQVGLAGIEYSLEEELRGASGRQTIEVDVNGRKVRAIGASDPAEPGHNLVLALDLDLQRAATEALQTAFDESKDFTRATQGVIVALDPRNGAVRALVTLPSYDNNFFAEGITSEAWQALTENPDHPLINLAVSGQYPPGSTFKMVTSAAGLQEAVINVNTLLGDGVDGANEGILYLPNRFAPGDRSQAQPFYCWIHSYGRGHGQITVRDALAQSCDIFYYQLGGGYGDFPGIGSETLGYYARQLGFAEPTGIDLPGEMSGLIPDDKWKRINWAERWTTGDTYNMSIGQGFVTATPLQVANYTAAVANRGSLYRPQLVERVTDGEGNVIREIQPELIRQVAVDPAYLDIIREGMYGAVNWPQGTAKVAQVPGVTVSGKTGTAEYFRDSDENGEPDRDSKGNMPTHAWFTSFAPYVDPEIVVTVFVANGGEGSAVAAPIAQRVLSAYFQAHGPTTPTPEATP